MTRIQLGDTQQRLPVYYVVVALILNLTKRIDMEYRYFCLEMSTSAVRHTLGGVVDAC